MTGKKSTRAATGAKQRQAGNVARRKSANNDPNALVRAVQRDELVTLLQAIEHNFNAHEDWQNTVAKHVELDTSEEAGRLKDKVLKKKASQLATTFMLLMTNEAKIVLRNLFLGLPGIDDTVRQALEAPTLVHDGQIEPVTRYSLGISLYKRCEGHDGADAKPPTPRSAAQTARPVTRKGRRNNDPRKSYIETTRLIILSATLWGLAERDPDTRNTKSTRGIPIRATPRLCRIMITYGNLLAQRDTEIVECQLEEAHHRRRPRRAAG